MPSLKPKVGYVLQTLGTGGIQTCLYNVARFLQGRFQFHFISTHSSSINPRFATLGKTAYIPQRANLVRHLRQLRLDLIQVHNLGWYTDCALAAGVPAIVERVAGNRVAGNPREGVDWVIASNRGTVPTIENTIDPKRITLIYNGVDLSRIRAAKPNRLGFADEDLIIGRVSRIGHGQNLGLLIRAMVEVNRRYPHAKLVIVGDRTQRDGYEDVWPELISLAEPLGKSVIFTGEIYEPFDIIAGFDIATCVSNHEGIPNSLIEPMALGKPVVSTNVGQVSELVEDEVSGLLIPSNDLDALVKALFRLIEQPELGRRLGEAGRRKVETQFNIEKQALKYADLYHYILGNPPGCSNGLPATLSLKLRRKSYPGVVYRMTARPDGLSVLLTLLPQSLRYSPAATTGALVRGLALRASGRRLGGWDDIG